MRLIDADALKAAITVDGYEHFSGCLSSSEVSLLEIVTDDINEAPTIDAVPVVRCRECKFWHEIEGWCDEHSHFTDSEGAFCHPWESSEWRMFAGNDFCSYGERKEGADHA